MNHTSILAMPTETRKLRVLMVTEDDPIYVRRFFDVFFHEYDRAAIDIVGITVSRAFHEPLPATARRITRFFGPVDTLRLLPQFLGAKLGGRSTASLARRAGIRVIAAESVNSSDYLETIRRLEVDVIVSVAAPEIFKSPLLGAARIGCLNIHSGKLPEYRGMMPTFWQMLDGRANATVTIHEMVPKLDAGGIVRTVDFPIERNDALTRIMIGTKQAGGRLMAEVLLDISRTRRMPHSTPLDMSKARLFKFPQPEDVKRFRRMGHRFF